MRLPENLNGIAHIRLLNGFIVIVSALATDRNSLYDTRK